MKGDENCVPTIRINEKCRDEIPKQTAIPDRDEVRRRCFYVINYVIFEGPTPDGAAAGRQANGGIGKGENEQMNARLGPTNARILRDLLEKNRATLKEFQNLENDCLFMTNPYKLNIFAVA